MTTKPLIIAHRGASGLVKFENTLASFEKAIELGVPMVEFDVRKTQDNLFVAFHDESIDGMKISDLSYQQLLDISRQKGFDVPLIEDVLKLCQGKIKLDIELKEVGYELEIVNLVKKYLDYQDYVIKSFLDAAIIAVKEADNQITTGLLLGLSKPKNLIATRLSEIFPEFRLFTTKADFVSPNYQLIKFGFAWRMKLFNQNIYVWTINDEKLMVETVKQGAFALITDRPDLALNLFDGN
ncbi:MULTISPECIES: glycerophosphodiester phosphodiesterase [Okeania]|uniref:Glycerophosphodiester phosphodiesterase n=1 Tax=Okeania hirsuta TaxID=1458930 RepID=A0A3N6PNL4_9CYAN|nr:MULTISPECIES: glycerophosphodiester phosphodiesterase [Okeania]NET12633.1 glycerophosphodiester phosphodiesterase [Okeania sp. SIO1H6]NES79500.1 glycerophosphodiester phosphodiesterase [Okeania sp. SIO1H4]NES92693.1 glycerophosphodiester phosphodiesterase [Okeania sp. SIO2B9]NET23153.1 glycerophosphodiester phosphodiesterase [Okeania sp. SIO1H5]NET75876.1 glycerophosphodiester phosphodiesterase [Okeania sp. SIO1F9]